MKTLNHDIANHELKHFYLLYGEETYLIRNYKSRLKAAAVGDDDMNYTYMEGKDIRFEEAKEAILAMPFFGDCRMVVIENSGIFKTAPKDDWESVLNAIPDTTYLVFVEANVDKKTRMYKLAGKIGYAANLDHPSPAMLEDWAGKSFQRANKGIERDALSIFVQMTSDSMERMQAEITKLTDYAADHDIITVQDVEAVTTPHIENRVFEMIELVAAGREQDALNRYYDLVTLHEESMRIHFLIAKHFNQLLIVKSMMDTGKTKENIASKMGLPPFVIGKLMRQARSFTTDQLKEYLTLCVSSDEAIKTGNLDSVLSVELLIITISRRKGAHSEEYLD